MADGNSRRTALVTGASYGVGAATALALANDGYDVAVTATRIGNLDDTVARVRANGARAFDLRHRQGGASADDSNVGNRVGALSHPGQRDCAWANGDSIAIACREGL